MRSRRRDWLALAALGLMALALRLAFLIDYDEDIDALRFRLGVERFNVAELRPHAPFYPVFVAAAKFVTLVVPSSRSALGIVCALGGAAAVLFTALTAYEVRGRRAAAFAGALALGSPMLWLSSQKLLSDVPGVAVYLAGLWLAARARRLPGQAAALRAAALVLFGLGLGVRLSYFPIALASLVIIACTDIARTDIARTDIARTDIARTDIARTEGRALAFVSRTRDLLLGVVLWLVPLIAIAGPKPLVATLWIQGIGHFTRWGGSAITVSSPGVRLSGAAWGLWANALGGPFPDAPPLRWLIAPPLLLLFFFCVRRRVDLRAALRAQPELLTSAIAYGIWVMLGQNIAYKPRHLLPLVPLAVVALAVGADKLAAERPRVATSAALGLALGWFADGALLCRAHLAPSPAAALCLALAEGKAAPLVITRDLGRMIEEAAPGQRVIVVKSDAALIDAVLSRGPEGARITSEALSAPALAELERRGLSVTTVFAEPRSRYVDALWNELALLEARPSR